MNLIGIDLDGTLEDSRLDMIAAVHRVRARFKLPARPDEAIRPWVNQGMDTLYRHCLDDYPAAGTEAQRLGKVRSAYEEDYLAHIADETRLYPGVDPALSALSKLGRVVVVTNKPERLSRRLLEALKVHSWIADVVGGDSGGEIKPSPAMLREAARRIRFDPAAGRAFMIGDTAADIKMGRAYGATTIWCAWGYADTPGETPDFTARAPADLTPILRSALDRPAVSESSPRPKWAQASKKS